GIFLKLTKRNGSEFGQEEKNLDEKSNLAKKKRSGLDKSFLSTILCQMIECISTCNFSCSLEIVGLVYYFTNTRQYMCNVCN
ncbi:hypothetical protein OFM39_34730, partial [Escherichia coli]|nr:hypothetical protein [Escherichia coli]